MSDTHGQVPAVGAIPAQITPAANVPVPEPPKPKGGPSYPELKALYEAQLIRAEKAEEKLNKIHLIINNPLYRMGPLVDYEPIRRVIRPDDTN